MPRKRLSSANTAAAVLLLDKPVGSSSRAVLDALEKRLRIRGLGHAGTLDPGASGLLIALAGDARRLQSFFLDGRKRYEARLRFGWTSATDDAEGPFERGALPVPPISSASLEPFLRGFRGEIEQVPPAVSAVRVSGVRAYRRARAGVALVLEPRVVHVQRLDVLRVGDGWADLLIESGKGLYVRALARDLGRALGCGAYVETLRRVASGGFDVERAKTPETIEPDDFLSVPSLLAVHPRIDIDIDLARRLLSGLTVPWDLTPTFDTFAWLRDVPLCQLIAAPGGIRAGLRVASAPGGGPPRL